MTIFLVFFFNVKNFLKPGGLWPCINYLSLVSCNLLIRIKGCSCIRHITLSFLAVTSFYWYIIQQLDKKIIFNRKIRVSHALQGTEYEVSTVNQIKNRKKREEEQVQNSAIKINFSTPL